MTLKQKNLKSLAFFDFPSHPKEGKEFITRRLFSLASRPVLAAKNQPIIPSQNALASKCFTNSVLFIFEPPVQKHKRFKPGQLRHKPETESDYNHKAAQIFTAPEIVDGLPTLKVFTGSDISFELDLPFYFSWQQRQKKPVIYDFELSSESFVVAKFENKLICSAYSEAIAGFSSPEQLTHHGNYHIACSVKEAAQPEFCPFELHLNSQTFGDFADLSLQIQASQPIIELFLETSQTAFQTDFFHSLKTRQQSSVLPFAMPVEKKFAYDIKSNPGKNLVLDVKTDLYAKSGSNKPFDRKTKAGGIFKIACKADQMKISQTKLFSDASFSNIKARVAPQKEVKAAFQQAEVKTPEKFKVQSKPGRFYEPISCRQFAVSKNLRLKLKLFRSSLAEKTFPMVVLHSYKPCPAKLVDEKIPIRFCNRKGLQPIFRSRLDYRIEHLELLANRQAFFSKRTLMKFLTKSHARYGTLKLRKILASHLTGKVFDCPLKKQPFRGTISEKASTKKIFSHPSGRFVDFVGILGRPLFFLMSITDLEFTDIVLPEHKRRLKAPKGVLWNYCGKNETNSLPKKLRTYSQNTVNSKKESFARVTTRRVTLKAARDLLAPLNRYKKAAGSYNFLFDNELKDKTYALSLKRKLRQSFSFIDGLPSAVKALFNLAMPISDAIANEKAAQECLIQSPHWSKTSRAFNCRLRLLPYPFGFPTFRFKADKMFFLHKEYSGKIKADLEKEIGIPAFSFFPTKRFFYSKFSLKNPQKWLYPASQAIGKDIQNFPFHFFVSSPENSFVYPLKPTFYKHTWQNADIKKLFARSFSLAFNFDTTSFAKKFLKFTHEFSAMIHDWAVPAETIPVIEEEQIDRLLLGRINLDCRFISGSNFAADQRISREKLRIKRLKPVSLPTKVKFALKEKQAEVFCPEILAFYHNFPEIPSGIFITQKFFKARYRQFFFPYAPAHSDAGVSSERYFEIDDTSQVLNFDSYEDLRISQIAQLGFEILEKEKTDYLLPLTVSVGSCEISAKYKLDDYLFPTCFKIRKLKNYKRRFKRKDFSIGKTFRIEKHLGLERRFPDFTFLYRAAPAQFAWNFSKSWAKPCLSDCKNHELPGIFSMESVHWVILLKSFMQIAPAENKFETSDNILSEKDFFLPEYTKLKAASSNVLFERKLVLSALDEPAQPFYSADANAAAWRLKVSDKSFVLNDWTKTAKKESSVSSKFNHESFAFSDKIFAKKTKTERIKISEKIPVDDSAKILFSDYKMHGPATVIVRRARQRADKLRPARSNFHPPYMPDWLDMEMDNIDKSVDNICSSIFEDKLSGVDPAKFASGVDSNP
jgi:hypothetical protein